MNLKVLGSGSSGNCYLLQNKNETLIIECGLPYKTILKGLNFNLSNVVGCLISHEHKDHCKAIGKVMNSAINVYTSFGTLKNLEPTDEGYWHTLNLEYFKQIKSGKQFIIGGFTVLPFETEHDVAEPLGFLIDHKDMGKLLFITDSYYCRYGFKGINHIMIECNYSKEILEKNIENGLNPVMASRLLKSHFSLENVKEFLKATDLSECEDITLIHLSDGNSNVAEFKTEIERLTGVPVYIADKGLEVSF